MPTSGGKKSRTVSEQAEMHQLQYLRSKRNDLQHKEGETWGKKVHGNFDYDY